MEAISAKYYIVVFPKEDEDDDVDIIPQNWLVTEETCWWPNYRSDKLRRACKTNELPKTGWEIHKMRILKSYDSYVEARKHLLDAEEDSDLSSETDETPKQRRTVASKRCLNFGNADDDLAVTPFKVSRKNKGPHLVAVSSPSPVKMPPPPPPPKQVVSKTKKCTLDTTQATLKSNSSSFNFDSRIPSGTSLVDDNAEIEQNSERGQATISQDEYRNTLRFSPLIDVPSRTSDKSGFEDFVIRNLGIQKAMLKQLHESVDILIQGQEINRRRNNPDVGPARQFALPIESMQSYNSLADEVGDAAVRTALVSVLAQRGGKDVGKCTRRVMGKLLTDKLAMEFSWLGSRGEKSSFSHGVFKDIVLEAVRHNQETGGAGDSAIEDAVKEWLKNAKKRTLLKSSSIAVHDAEEDNLN